jgi:hypothetical protein
MQYRVSDNFMPDAYTYIKLKIIWLGFKRFVTLNYKVLFMHETSEPLETLQDIRQMMEKSSRFISLSGWSGVAAGLCALIGAWNAYGVIHSSRGDQHVRTGGASSYDTGYVSVKDLIDNKLFIIAILTFIAAFIFAFLFTYIRSKKKNVPIWGNTARRLLLNVSVPMFVGFIYLLKLIESGAYGLIAPGCLIFYGLALVNGSKYTLGEIRYLGYGQIVLGIINCFAIGFGLYFWAVGFGVLHILYGVIMWQRYERG